MKPEDLIALLTSIQSDVAHLRSIMVTLDIDSQYWKHVTDPALTKIWDAIMTLRQQR